MLFHFDVLKNLFIKTPRDLESQVRSNSYVAKSWHIWREIALQLLANVEQVKKEELIIFLE